MNHTRFTSLLRQKYPASVVASVHGGVSGARTAAAVSIVFSADGKAYDYSGTYTAILEQLGIKREWCVVSGASIIARYYTEAEAQEDAQKRNTKDAEYRTMATARGWHVDPVIREYTVECRKS